MKIAIYAQQLLEKALQAAKSLEPISLCGMYDAGVDYLFSLSVPLLTSELPTDVHPVFVDLSGVTKKETVPSEIGFALASEFSDIPLVTDYIELTRQIRNLCRQTKIVLDIYVGQDAVIDEELFLFLNRLRNLLGWQFSYVLFLNTRAVFYSHAKSGVLEKILKRNILSILPRNPTDSLTIIHNYEERYGKTISLEQQKTIIKLSGGNSGLIKAMTLQALDDSKWQKPDLLDERLFFRIKGLAEDVPQEFRSLLVSPKSTKQNMQVVELLLRYGYLVRDKNGFRVFSSLLPEFVKGYIAKSPEVDKVDRFRADETILRLSLSQRKVLAHLETHPGEIISKDTIAQILWGDQWADRYSAWAIDQLLSTLREKLTSMKYKGKIITKKSEGIVFLP